MTKLSISRWARVLLLLSLSSNASAATSGGAEPAPYQLLLTAGALVLLFSARRSQPSPWQSIKVTPLPHP